MPRKLRKVPQFLKEIPLGRGSQGDYANEWDYAEMASSYQREDYRRAQSNPEANYLGWWGRRVRPVFYFGDNKRTYEHAAEWSKYDWYLREATYINKFINLYNEQVDNFNKGYFNPNPYWSASITIAPPKEPQHTLGIQRWLQNKVDEYNQAVSELKSAIAQKLEQERQAKIKQQRDEEFVKAYARMQAEQERQAKIKQQQDEEFVKAYARMQAEQERQAKIKQQQEELRKRDDALVQTFDKRISLLEKTVDDLGKQKLDFNQYTITNMTELDAIRRDLLEIDAQSVQNQKETNRDMSRLEQNLSALSNKSNEIDGLYKTVQINTETLSKLDKKYALLERRSRKEAYNSIVSLTKVDNEISKVKKGIEKDLTAIQEENKKINKDYIDGISVFKEQQKQLGEKVAANEKDNDNKIQSLRRDLIEVKKEIGTCVKYDVHSNNAAKRRTGTIFKNRVHARQYDAARDILKSYLSTIFAQYTTV